MRVYRYEIALSDEPTTLELDAGANVLHVDVKPGALSTISLWATEHGGPRQKRRFVVKGTGHEFDGTALGFVGTVLMGERFVWHVFEELDEAAPEYVDKVDFDRAPASYMRRAGPGRQVIVRDRDGRVCFSFGG